MKKRIAVILLSFLFLLVGALIYSIARTPGLYINQWIDYLFSAGTIHRLQIISQRIDLPSWLINSMPDALWMASLTLMILVIWDFKLYSKSVTWLLLALFTGLGFEILQKFGIVPGTFDFTDLIFILIGALLPVSYFYLRHKYENKWDRHH
ncbi:MAG: hypothetical protein ABJC12_07850 [Saprospiraceae bacterium]